MGGWSNSTVYTTRVRDLKDQRAFLAISVLEEVAKQLDPQRVVHGDVARMILDRLSNAKRGCD